VQGVDLAIGNQPPSKHVALKEAKSDGAISIQLIVHNHLTPYGELQEIHCAEFHAGL
jgi:hypothetical protein